MIMGHIYYLFDHATLLSMVKKKANQMQQ